MKERDLRDINDFLHAPYQDSFDFTNELTDISDDKKKIAGKAALIFKSGASLLAVDSKAVYTVVDFMNVEKIPFVKNRYNLGFITLKGVPIPVVDFELALSLNNKSLKKTKVVILKEQELLTALFVETVLGIYHITSETPDEINTRTSKAKITELAHLVSVLNSAELTSLLEER